MAQFPHLLGSGTRHWLKIVVVSSWTASIVSLGRFFALTLAIYRPKSYVAQRTFKGRHRALSEGTFFADPKLEARPLWRGLRYTYLLHETSMAARGSKDGPAQPCQREGGSTIDLMVITRWMSYEAALLGTAEDLKRAQRESLHASQGLHAHTKWISLFDHMPATLYAILPQLS